MNRSNPPQNRATRYTLARSLFLQIAYLPLRYVSRAHSNSLLTIFPIAVHAELGVELHKVISRRQVRWVRFGARHLKGDRTDSH